MTWRYFSISGKKGQCGKSDMNKNTNPELIEKSLEKLELYGDLKIKNAIKEYHNEVDKKSGKDYTRCN